MRRWGIVFGSAILLIVLYFTGWHVQKSRARREREAVYRSVLLSYSAALAPGVNREQVEDFLHAKRVEYSKFPCTEGNSECDITRIGEEPSPWYCSRNIVYVSFQFEAGRLNKIALYRKLEDCL